MNFFVMNGRLANASGIGEYLTRRARPAGRPVSRVTFVTYLVTFCSRLEAPSDVLWSVCVGLVIPDKRLKFGDPRLNPSREIPSEAA